MSRGLRRHRCILLSNDASRGIASISTQHHPLGEGNYRSKPSAVYVHVSSAQSYKPVAEVVKCVSMYAEALLAATKQVEQAQHALDVLERHCSNENSQSFVICAL